jgi:hypothetical protein
VIGSTNQKKDRVETGVKIKNGVWTPVFAFAKTKRYGSKALDERLRLQPK